MMPDMTLLAVAAALAVVSGSALQAATGFGFGLIAAPLLFAATSPAEAVGLLMVLGLEVNVLTLAGERRRPVALRGEVVRLLAWSAPGTLAGVAVLRSLDETALQVLVTAGVVAGLAVRHLGRHRPASAPPRWALPATGLAAGALNTATSTSGPPLVLYLLRRRVTPAQMRDTLSVTFLAFTFLGVAALAVTGTREAIPGLGWLAAMVPLVAIGHLAGRRGFARLEAGRYELAVTVALLGAAAAGLLTVVL